MSALVDTAAIRSVRPSVRPYIGLAVLGSDGAVVAGVLGRPGGQRLDPADARRGAAVALARPPGSRRGHDRVRRRAQAVPVAARGVAGGHPTLACTPAGARARDR